MSQVKMNAGPVPPCSSCDCAHHRAEASSPAGEPGGRWASLLPLLACAVCPACLSAYAKVLSFVGIGVSLSESTHLLLLVVAIGVTLVVSAWRAWRLHRVGPLVISVVGSALLVLSHALEENPLLLWSGVAVLLGGALWERRVWRRFQARRDPVAPGFLPSASQTS
ncbi:MerC family mercury resistance protein [Corallococcus sicarius]|uniref:MerC domain-containing protein n=1 Tax=Corallococcus sicarius TaxID=2316726 RepID=A0A3A8P7X5_9BACT|nr:MerC family mercury resistance protein [Corallococcus sicarius]RKH47874.1 MerC domain-containing protein [Corallococcus sicarius]